MNCNNKLIKVAITSGEPAGIGPDLCLQLPKLQQQLDLKNVQLIIIADPQVLRARANDLGIKINIIEFNKHSLAINNDATNNSLLVMPLTVAAKVYPQQLNTANSNYVVDIIKTAVTGCMDDMFDAMVTAPIHKQVINQAGISFSGHTEYLAQLTNSNNVAMMFTSDTTKLALITTHIPLSQVASAITSQHLTSTLQLLHKGLKQNYNISNPKIAVCGLNPHAGEGGYLGEEENNIIIPTMNKLINQGIQLYGPLAADTAFNNYWFNKVDLIVAMYHDQGLAPFKAVCFGNSVNVTIGLPIIRTSVDHGTALDLAGSGNINTGSFIAAINEAVKLARNTRD
jgi:4-hydroxythreonine-4-phosphate dehydrogenase